MRTEFLTNIMTLLAAVVGLITAVVSLVVALNTSGKLGTVQDQIDGLFNNVKCVEGPRYSNDVVSLRVSPVFNVCWFAAVSQNAPDSVWVQRVDKPDAEGWLRLEAYGSKGSYGVYMACNEHIINRLRELQARAANQQPANITDIPRGARQICTGEAN